jgi:hypothetical protein
MTPKITAVLLSLSLSASAFGQSIQQNRVHIGFAYPLSTNGVNAAQYTNTLSLHAISGVSYSENAFCASGIASIIKDSAKGFVGSGLVNVIGNKATGAQAAGLINYVRNEVEGVEAAGFMNLAGCVRGAQLAGFANIATGNVAGAQIGGFINIADDVAGQTGGFANVSDSSNAQVAGFINTGRQSRTQIAGFANVGGDVRGVQIAGFINVAKNVKGAQIAGFINVAESCDYPIGLINIIKNGEKYIGVMVDETGTTFATFRSGSRKLYGIIGIGYNGSHSRDIYAGQAGMGMHIPISRMVRISTEVTSTTFTNFNQDADMQSTIRIIPSVRFGNFELYAGPSFNYALSLGHGGSPFDHYSLWTEKTFHHTHELYIGGCAGIQFRF